MRFTKPGLEEVFDALMMVKMPREKQLSMVKKLLITQGEWDFEQEIKDHPHGVALSWLGTGTMDIEFREWLDLHFDPSEYILMPTNSMGKYKDKWNWVYFKRKDQAALYKLAWG